MSGKDKPPAPIVRQTPRGLSPVSGFDAELLDGVPNGTEFNLVRRSRRSVPHHRTYWKALGEAVKATRVSASAKHLHRELKLATGYTDKILNRRTGDVVEVPDSIAFDEMTQEEFGAYFDAAIAELAEWVGYDPLKFMEAA